MFGNASKEMQLEETQSGKFCQKGYELTNKLQGNKSNGRRTTGENLRKLNQLQCIYSTWILIWTKLKFWDLNLRLKFWDADCIYDDVKELLPYQMYNSSTVKFLKPLSF